MKKGIAILVVVLLLLPVVFAGRAEIPAKHSLLSMQNGGSDSDLRIGGHLSQHVSGPDAVVSFRIRFDPADDGYDVISEAHQGNDIFEITRMGDGWESGGRTMAHPDSISTDSNLVLELSLNDDSDIDNAGIGDTWISYIGYDGEWYSKEHIEWGTDTHALSDGTEYSMVAAGNYGGIPVVPWIDNDDNSDATVIVFERPVALTEIYWREDKDGQSAVGGLPYTESKDDWSCNTDSDCAHPSYRCLPAPSGSGNSCQYDRDSSESACMSQAADNIDFEYYSAGDNNVWIDTATGDNKCCGDDYQLDTFAGPDGACIEGVYVSETSTGHDNKLLWCPGMTQVIAGIDCVDLYVDVEDEDLRSTLCSNAGLGAQEREVGYSPGTDDNVNCPNTLGPDDRWLANLDLSSEACMAALQGAGLAILPWFNTNERGVAADGTSGISDSETTRLNRNNLCCGDDYYRDIGHYDGANDALCVATTRAIESEDTPPFSWFSAEEREFTIHTLYSPTDDNVGIFYDAIAADGKWYSCNEHFKTGALNENSISGNRVLTGERLSRTTGVVDVGDSDYGNQGEWQGIDDEDFSQGGQGGLQVSSTANSLNFNVDIVSFVSESTTCDKDGDGFSCDLADEGCDESCSVEDESKDCDDNIAGINPFAQEIPGNDVDENCDGLADQIDVADALGSVPISPVSVACTQVSAALAPVPYVFESGNPDPAFGEEGKKWKYVEKNTFVECCPYNTKFCKNFEADDNGNPLLAKGVSTGGSTYMLADFEEFYATNAADGQATATFVRSDNFVNDFVYFANTKDNGLISYDLYIDRKDLKPKSYGTDRFISLPSTTFPETNWSDYDFLEFDVYFATPEFDLTLELFYRRYAYESDTIRKSSADYGSAGKFRIADHVSGQLATRRWTHVKIPLTDLNKKTNLALFMFIIDTDKLGNFAVKLDGKTFNSIVALDKIRLTKENSQELFCDVVIDDGNIEPRWISNLDGEVELPSTGAACDSFPGFAWISDGESGRCCGDDGEEDTFFLEGGMCIRGVPLVGDVPFTLVEYSQGDADYDSVCVGETCTLALEKIADFDLLTNPKANRYSVAFDNPIIDDVGNDIKLSWNGLLKEYIEFITFEDIPKEALWIPSEKKAYFCNADAGPYADTLANFNAEDYADATSCQTKSKFYCSHLGGKDRGWLEDGLPRVGIDTASTAPASSRTQKSRTFNLVLNGDFKDLTKTRDVNLDNEED